MSTAPSMMSLRQRHIDPQLALGSQRFVESSHVAGGHHGEGSSYPPSWPRPNLRQSHGQVDTLGLAVSHPSIFCASTPSHSSYSSSVPHSSFFHSSFQPMDPIPDSPPRRSRSYGYLLCLCSCIVTVVQLTKLVWVIFVSSLFFSYFSPITASVRHVCRSFVTLFISMSHTHACCLALCLLEGL